MTARLFVGNFDFEQQLASSTGLSRTSLCSGLEWSWLAEANSEDLIWTDRVPTEAMWELMSMSWGPLPRVVSSSRELPQVALDLVPWGWSEPIRNWGETHGCHCDAPPLDVVRRVNARGFRLQLELEWEIGLAGSRLLTGLEEAMRTVESQREDALWVIKAGFGMSGRERFLGRGRRVSDQLPGWLRRRLTTSGPAVFEPWVERDEEIGIQLEIPRTGHVTLVGLTPLLVDANGQFRGSRLQDEPVDRSFWQPAVELALQTAERLQGLGYFGPLGIDAMAYRDADGTKRLRPLQDLNARWTMGRLALGLRKRLRPGEIASWWHERTSHCPNRIALEKLVATLKDARFLFVCPPELELPRVSLLLIARDPHTLAELENSFHVCARSGEDSG